MVARACSDHALGQPVTAVDGVGFRDIPPR